MKPRFDENQPWFFGWMPSDYVETLSEAARETIQLRRISLAALDRYQELANACPKTRTVDEAKFLGALSGSLGVLPDVGREACLELSSLAVSYCKPFTEIGLYEPAENVTDILDAYGLRTRILNRHRGRANVYIGYNDAIIDAHVDCEQAFERRDMTLDERSLINGILFGFSNDHLKPERIGRIKLRGKETEIELYSIQAISVN